MCMQSSNSSSTTETTTSTILTKKLRRRGFICSKRNGERRYFNRRRCSQRRQQDTYSMENNVGLELPSSLLKPLRNGKFNFSFEENIKDPIYTWKLTKFSTLFSDSYTSDSFSSGGSNWVLKVSPNGDGYGKGNSLSLYLLSESNEKAYVQAKLRVLDQIKYNHVEKLVEGWPNATYTNNGWGFEKFVSLADLKDASKGLVVDDAIKVEVEIIAFSKTDSTLSDYN